MVSGDKQAILNSVRDNLATPRQAVPESPHQVEVAPAISSPPVTDRASLGRQFTNELTALGAHVHLARTAEEAQAYIKDVIHRYQARRIAISEAPRLTSLAVEALLHAVGTEIISLPRGSQSNGLDEYKRQLMTADMGITGVEFGLADSGTLVLRTRETEGRLASLLPPVHLAIITTDQILPSIVEFIFQFELPPPSSGVIFITGPSRTADIELTLTIGVHGPKELHVLVLP
jgi:L-lactate dehydrogenase complex protein LldG